MQTIPRTPRTAGCTTWNDPYGSDVVAARVLPHHLVRPNDAPKTRRSRRTIPGLHLLTWMAVLLSGGCTSSRPLRGESWREEPPPEYVPLHNNLDGRLILGDVVEAVVVDVRPARDAARDPATVDVQVIRSLRGEHAGVLHVQWLPEVKIDFAEPCQASPDPAAACAEVRAKELAAVHLPAKGERFFLVLHSATSPRGGAPTPPLFTTRPGDRIPATGAAEDRVHRELRRVDEELSSRRVFEVTERRYWIAQWRHRQQALDASDQRAVEQWAGTDVVVVVRRNWKGRSADCGGEPATPFRAHARTPGTAAAIPGEATEKEVFLVGGAHPSPLDGLLSIADDLEAPFLARVRPEAPCHGRETFRLDGWDAIVPLGEVHPFLDP